MHYRRLFLVRHGTPQFPHQKKHFYSRSDYVLSPIGQEDARLMADRLKKSLHLPFHFYSSPLLRSRHTAEALTALWPEAGNPTLVDDLMELNCGVWEGMLFSDVEKQYPEGFALRRSDPDLYTPPQGESHLDGQDRVYKAIQNIVNATDHDVVIVAHAMVNLLFLAKALNWSMKGLWHRAQPYGGYNVLRMTKDGYEPILLGRMPTDTPSKAKINFLQKRYEMPKGVRMHTATVRELALSYANKINAARQGTSEQLIDLECLAAACDLHDIARGQTKHAKAGAAIVDYEGYPSVAEIIRHHQDLPQEKQDALDESSLLYLADKNVLGCDVVGIEARFNDSYYVVDKPEKRAKNARRKQVALKLDAALRTLLQRA